MLTFKQYIETYYKILNENTVINAETHPLYKKRDSENIDGLRTDSEVNSALQTDATSRRILNQNDKPKNGDLVGGRLNINVLKNTNVPILTLHKNTNTSGYKNGKGFYNGKARTYQQVLELKNAFFNVNQSGRANIFSGKQNKHPMASVDGEYQETSTPNFDGVEARFNPKKHHLFVDNNGNSIKSAEYVTLHGHKAYLRGKIEYYSKNNAPKPLDNHPTESKYIDD